MFMGLGLRAWLVIGAALLIWSVGAYVQDLHARLGAAERQAEILEADLKQAKAQTKVETAVREAGERTHQRKAEIETAETQGVQEIRDAVALEDFDALDAAWRRAIERVWDGHAGAPVAGDDSSAGGVAPGVPQPSDA